MINYICENCDSVVLYDATFCSNCGVQFESLNDGIGKVLNSVDALIKILQNERKDIKLSSKVKRLSSEDKKNIKVVSKYISKFIGIRKDMSSDLKFLIEFRAKNRFS